MKLQRDQPLIVIHTHDRIVIAARSLMKQAVGGKRAVHFDSFSGEIAYCRGNRLFFIIAEDSLFAGMRIQRGNGDARSSDPEQLVENSMCKCDRGPYSLARQR